MFTLPMVASEVVCSFGHLPPQHRSEVVHLHVRLHLDGLERIHMDLEVGMVEGPEVLLHLGQALLDRLVDGGGGELGLHVDPQPRVVIELPNVTADDVAKDYNVLQFCHNRLPNYVSEHLLDEE